MRWVCFFVLSFSLGATTFQVQGVKEQLKSADGVIIGHYLRSKGIRLENGMIATQMIFKMNQEHGLQSDLFGMDEIIIHFPGGKIENLRSQIEGVPEFVPGEKVALMIKSVENRYWGLNLGMGSYKVINYGKETMLINSIFPDDPKIGQIRLEEFEQHVKEIKGSRLKVVTAPEYPIDLEGGAEPVVRAPASIEEDSLEGKKRAIASNSEDVQNESEQQSLGVFWLVAVLAFLGGAFRFLSPKNAR